MMRNDDGLDHEVVGTMMMMSGGGGGGGGGQRKGGGVVVQQVVGAGGLKKGPWTAAEDAVLVEYVKKNGEGNWNSVQRNSGLLRCGKSCRLRWANHLRPNLKKGAFTPEEERVIIELHAKYGNKWARMATQLPGRTDNEIKNYWNTRMKRRQRAGLPVYPREFQDQTRSFHNMQHHLEQNTLSNHRINNNNTTKSPSLFSVFRKTPNYTSTFSFSDDGLSNFSSPPSSCFQGHNSNNANHLSSSVLYSNNINPSHHHYFNSQNGTVLSPLSPSPLVSQFPPPSAAPPVTGGENIPSNVMTFTSLIMGDYDENDVDQLESFTFGSTSELPSLQTPPRSVSSNAAGGVCVVAEGSDNANSNNNNNNARMTNRNDEDTLAGDGGGVNLVIENNSGLLDMLLMESKAMCRKRKAEELLETGVISSTAADEDGKADAAGAKRNCSDDDGGRQPHDNLVFSLSPAVMEPAEEETAAEMVSSMDDDLLSLLTNFPCSIPLPEWYRDHTDTTAHNTHNVNVKAPATATAADCYGGGVNGSPAHDQGRP